MIKLVKLKILTPLPKLPKNVKDLDKIIAAKGFKKSNKLPNLVTLPPSVLCWQYFLIEKKCALKSIK